MKILLAHVVHSPGIEDWYQEIASASGDDLEVSCFCVTLNPPGPRLSWKELDFRWRTKEKTLMGMYRRLQAAASECDVLLLYNGTNVHFEFFEFLPTFNVFCCFDDPESSGDLSAPVASHFDAVFYGNIASRFQYEHWGCKKHAWLPIFTAPSDVPSKEELDNLLFCDRDIDIVLVCEKNLYRQNRLNSLVKKFPQAKCFGKGWDSGAIDNSTLQKLYGQTKIGWNVHNSTGPINRRLFALMAFGVFQICDNKTGLGKIFQLGKEVLGFDTISEAIEITQYYLEHESERRQIAANGLQRFWKDYHTTAIWKRIKIQLKEWGAEKKKVQDTQLSFPKRHVSDVFFPYFHNSVSIAKKVIKTTRKVLQAWQEIKVDNPKKLDERAYLIEPVQAYKENPEMKGINMAKDRLHHGEPFEWPNMLALNWSVTALIRNAKSIVEIGSGTGPFAEFATVDETRTIHCFEEDNFAREMAIKKRSFPNVKYYKNYNGNLLKYYDLLVSIDVIEHVSDLIKFLSFCSSLAPRAIFTTPNRSVVRGTTDIGPPLYQPHVREFDTGEFYWILKLYYKEVSLYYMPNVYVPWIEPMTIVNIGTPIIAECTGPSN